MDEAQQARTKQQVMHAHLLGEVSELLERIAVMKSGIDQHIPVSVILKEQIINLRTERESLTNERKRIEKLASRIDTSVMRIEKAPITVLGSIYKAKPLPETRGISWVTLIGGMVISAVATLVLVGLFRGYLSNMHFYYN